MFVFVFRGTGLFVMYYSGIAYLCWYYILDAHSFHENNFGAITSLTCAILSGVHALIIIRENRPMRYGHGAHQPRGLWHDSFLLIPVVIWPLIFIALSIWAFAS